MDHGHSRPKKNWEFTDGGIYLLRELATIQPEKAQNFMQDLARSRKSICATPELTTTLWKQLPTIAKALGNRPFKQTLELCLEDMIYDTQHDNQLAAAAATDCTLFILAFLGARIVQGRVLNMMNGERLWSSIETIMPPN